MRVLFLVMSVLGAFFDGLYFLMMVIHDKYTLVGYNFHMLGMFFSAMAFIAVVFRWNKALQIHSKSSTLTKISYLLVVGNCLVTLVAIIDSLMARNYDEYLKRWSYEAVATTNCSTIFLYSSGLYFYARYVRSKLIVSGRDSLYNVSSLEYEVHRTQLLRKLFKMNVVLGVCSACYFLRVVCLGMVLVDIERDETTTDSISLYWWFTLSLWIPSLGSGLILLYTMRENKEKHFSDGQMLRIANESSAEASERQNSKFSSSYYSCESTDSTPDFNNDDSAECLDVRLPLISDDCADIAFQYETTSHIQRYRHESLSTGTMGSQYEVGI